MQVEDGATKEPLELLSKAEMLTGETGPLSDKPDVRFRLLAVTLNNLGCYYKRTKKAREDGTPAMMMLVAPL